MYDALMTRLRLRSKYFKAFSAHFTSIIISFVIYLSVKYIFSTNRRLVREYFLLEKVDRRARYIINESITMREKN